MNLWPDRGMCDAVEVVVSRLMIVMCVDRNLLQGNQATSDEVKGGRLLSSERCLSGSANSKERLALQQDDAGQRRDSYTVDMDKDVEATTTYCCQPSYFGCQHACYQEV
jgi:hypothetical protein